MREAGLVVSGAHLSHAPCPPPPPRVRQGHVVGLSPDAMQQKGMEDIATVCTLCNEAKIIYQDGKYDR